MDGAWPARPGRRPTRRVTSPPSSPSKVASTPSIGEIEIEIEIDAAPVGSPVRVAAALLPGRG
jgi:hypothetical protein